MARERSDSSAAYRTHRSFQKQWRRVWDSNPRIHHCITRFRIERLKPGSANPPTWRDAIKVGLRVKISDELFPDGRAGQPRFEILVDGVRAGRLFSLSRNREDNPQTSARAVVTGDDFHRIPHHQWQRKAQDSGVLDYRSPPSRKKPRKSTLFRGFLTSSLTRVF